MPCDSVGSGIFAFRAPPRSSPPRRTPPGARASRGRGWGTSFLAAALEARAAAASAAAASAALPLAPAFARRGRPPSRSITRRADKIDERGKAGRAVSDAFGPRREAELEPDWRGPDALDAGNYSNYDDARGTRLARRLRKRADFEGNPGVCSRGVARGRAGDVRSYASAPSPRPGLAVRPRRCRAWPRDRLHLAEAC